MYLDLSILSAGGQHLRVSAEAHAQHGIVHHHEVVLSLVLQILDDKQSMTSFLLSRGFLEGHASHVCLYLSDFPSGEVPHLNEAINRASDQVLPIRGEPGTLHMRLLSKLSRKGTGT